MAEPQRCPTCGHPMDELAMRIRSLEAERLRPTPQPLPYRGAEPDLPALAKAAADTSKRRKKTSDPDTATRALRRAGEHYRARNNPADTPTDG